jgi:hypothetical protein
MTDFLNFLKMRTEIFSVKMKFCHCREHWNLRGKISNAIFDQLYAPI